MSIRSTRPVILNSFRQAQNLLSRLLWLFVGASKKHRAGFEISSACRCADQQNRFLFAQWFYVKHISSTEFRESACLAGVHWMKSGYQKAEILCQPMERGLGSQKHNSKSDRKLGVEHCHIGTKGTATLCVTLMAKLGRKILSWCFLRKYDCP